MKVYIGKYKSWFGPYQLAEALCFWVPSKKNEYGVAEQPEWVHDFGTWLAYGSFDTKNVYHKPLAEPKRKPTALHRFLLWVDGKRNQTIKVRIDPWDVYSMDHTLANIIVPMLKLLKNEKYGAPGVDDDDVPAELRRSAATPLTQEEIDCGGVDELYFKRWDWVLGEMIFAFESKLDYSWEDQFYSGKSDYRSEAILDENGKPKFYRIVEGENHTWEVDREGLTAYKDRIDNGHRLFGKYYGSLWT